MILLIACFLGSPPHTRGIPTKKIPDGAIEGFTPAYAGNTCPRAGNPLFWKVHPRIRGEYVNDRIKSPVIMGSPPHTRGILAEVQNCFLSAGFTPAYAGNTVMRLILTLSA